MQMIIDEEGNLIVNGFIRPNQDPIETSSTKKLCFKNNGDIKLALSEEKLQIKNEIRPKNISGPTDNDFVMYNTPSGSHEQPQAMIGTGDPEIDGDLSTAGTKNDNNTPVSAVYYMDNEGVFTQNGVLFDFAYANIEREGRTEYDGGVEQTNLYYIKDHLGSTRMTIDEDGNQLETFSYTAYGIVKEFVVRSGDATREKFTGKEFDQEGEGNGVAGIQAYYFGARYYDPEIGIFLSTDPKMQDFFSYGYCAGNPIILVDSDGMLADWAWGLIYGGILATAGGVSGAIIAEKRGSELWKGALIGSAIGFVVGYGFGYAFGEGIAQNLGWSNFTDEEKISRSIEITERTESDRSIVLREMFEKGDIEVTDQPYAFYSKGKIKIPKEHLSSRSRLMEDLLHEPVHRAYRVAGIPQPTQYEEAVARISAMKEYKDIPRRYLVGKNMAVERRWKAIHEWKWSIDKYITDWVGDITPYKSLPVYVPKELQHLIPKIPLK